MEPLANGEAHVWITDPDGIRHPDLLERYFALLDPEERARHRRLRGDQSRREYLVAHALARVVLSRYVAVAPESWTFSRGEHGRPEISGPPEAPPLRFNLSHTRGLVACAVARGRDIGVDVENAARRGRHLEIAERFFGEAELDAIRALPPDQQKRRFLEVWTLKEAYLKARGSGISISLRGFQFQISEGAAARIRIGFDPALVRDDPESWQFALHHPTAIHTLALAIRRQTGRDLTIRLFEGVPETDAAGSEIAFR